MKNMFSRFLLMGALVCGLGLSYNQQQYGSVYTEKMSEFLPE